MIYYLAKPKYGILLCMLLVLSCNFHSFAIKTLPNDKKKTVVRASLRQAMAIKKREKRMKKMTPLQGPGV